MVLDYEIKMKTVLKVKVKVQVMFILRHVVFTVW
jgi:hypothetical protein